MIASIDIGTNSVLLLVADKSHSGLTVIEERQRIPRLGKNVDKEKNLHVDSQKRVIDVIKEYKNILMGIDPVIVGKTIVTATSAVRDASNRDEFISRVKQETGWSINVLSGKEEAVTTYRGALQVLNVKENERYVILDIGGGSTEVATGTGLKLEEGFSIDMGSVRYSERYLNSVIPDEFEINTARENIKAHLRRYSIPEKPFQLIGVAGTVTSIAAIQMSLQQYLPQLINGYYLKKVEVVKYISEFSEISSDEIENRYPEFLIGRGDVILAGLLILDEFLDWYDETGIIVSTGGIRHGIIT